MTKTNAAPSTMMIANYDWMWNRSHPGLAVMYDFTGEGVS